MRRTRLSRPRGISSRLSALFMFVLIAVALVGAGYLLGRFVLSSILSRYPGTPATSTPGQGGSSSDTVTTTIALDSLAVYRIQAGAFSSKDNAAKLAQACIARGVPAYVMAPDPLHKVYCGVVPSREAAEKMAAEVISRIAGTVIGADEKLYIGSFEIPAIRLSVSGDRKYVTSLEEGMKKARGALDTLLGFWDAYYLKASPPDVRSASRDVTSILTNLKGTSPPDNARNIHSACTSLLESLSKALAGAEAVYGGDSLKGPEAMTELMKVTDMLASFGR